MKALPTNLTSKERDLLRETERDRMVELDEDQLLELHRRVRRARTKHVTLHRRRASAGVVDRGARTADRDAAGREAGKAEIFEEALARVSRRLAVAAQQSATALRAERLAAARRPAVAPPAPRAGGSDQPVPAGAAGGPTGGPSAARLRRDASSLAAGARRQARRDSL